MIIDDYDDYIIKWEYVNGFRKKKNDYQFNGLTRCV